MTSQSYGMARAIAWTILDKYPGSVPTTTLASSASAGDDHIFLPTTPFPAGFVPGCRLHPWDQTDERTWAIKAVDITTGRVDLKLSGLGRRSPPITGLLTDHAAGVTLTSNLCFNKIIQPGDMLASGYPLFFVIVRRERGKLKATGQEMPRFEAHLEVRRSALQQETPPNTDPDDANNAAEDPNDWEEYLETATHNDLEGIVKAVLKNRNLTDLHGSWASGLGDPSGDADYQKLLDHLITESGNEQFVGMLDMTIQGNLQSTHS